MDIVVKGRHTAVPQRFRKHVQAKLVKLERLDPKAYRVDAELSREHNPRLAGIRERVELTVFSRGPVIRAGAAARDPYAALDAAAAKLNERLRRAADRRGSHHGSHHGGNHRPLAAVAIAPDGVASTIGTFAAGTISTSPPADSARVELAELTELEPDGYDVPDPSPLVLHEKTHQAEPMTLDDALSNMELVGHDFYLFLDLPTGMPSVVYRRCGYDYGVIRLGPAGSGTGAGAGAENGVRRRQWLTA